ncbi:hypothetical protein D3C72_179240 [compost metagenome]
MNKALPLALSTLLLLGCDGRLVFQHPQFIPNSQDTILAGPEAEISPKQVKLGETLTLRLSGLSDEVVTQAYLQFADLPSGGDFEFPDPKPGHSPVFRLGRLKPVNGAATLSFEVRSTMGNDQFGNPFTLAGSQSMAIVITERDKYGRIGSTSSGNLSFTILPSP